MAKISELKEMIVQLKLDLVRATIPEGHCPYAYYTPGKRSVDCGDISCGECKRSFLQDMEAEIRKEVRSL